MLITKADGTEEEWKPEKLRRSLERAGARGNEIESIVRDVEREIIEGTTTSEIYKKAFLLLKHAERPVAAKYSMRRALFGLGPTGFPFEDYVARLFEFRGYNTKTRLTLKGKCVTHEIDVAAYKPEHSFIAEVKFHMRPGMKSDIQTALYSYARFLDLQAAAVCEEDTCGVTSLMIVTNTKFSSAAVEYAKCTGLELLSWGYPHKDTLQDRIEEAKLYPVTTLTRLSVTEKAALLKNGLILCSDILKTPEALGAVIGREGKRGTKAYAVIEEARQLCGT